MATPEFGPRIGAGEWEGVHPRLQNLLMEYMRRTGVQLVIRSGKEGRGNNSKSYHPKGMAVDLWIKRPDGSLIPHGAGGYGKESRAGAASGYYEYEKLAKELNALNQELNPGTPFRWGGYFSGGPNKLNSLDTMHFDIGDAGMGGGSFETGPSKATLNAWASAGLPLGGGAPSTDNAPSYTIMAGSRGTQPSADTRALAYTPEIDISNRATNAASSLASEDPQQSQEPESALMRSIKGTGAQHDPNDRRMLWEEDMYGRTRNPFQHNKGRQLAERALESSPMPFANPNRAPTPSAPPPSPFEMRGAPPSPGSNPGVSPFEMRGPSPMPATGPTQPVGPAPSPFEMRGPVPPSPAIKEGQDPIGPPPMPQANPGPAKPPLGALQSLLGAKGGPDTMSSGAGREDEPGADAAALVAEGGDPLMAFNLLLQEATTKRPKSISPDSRPLTSEKGETREPVTRKSRASESSGRGLSSLLSYDPNPQGMDAQGNPIGAEPSSGPDWNTGLFGGSLALGQMSGYPVDLSGLFAMQQKRKAAEKEAQIARLLRQNEAAAAAKLFGAGSGSPAAGEGGGAATGAAGRGAAPSPSFEDFARAEANRVAQAVFDSSPDVSFEDAVKIGNDHYRTIMERERLFEDRRQHQDTHGLNVTKFETEERRTDEKRARDVSSGRAFARTMYEQYRDIDPTTAGMFLDFATGPDDQVPTREYMESIAGGVPQVDEGVTRARQGSGILTSGGRTTTPGQVYEVQNPTGIRQGQDAAAQETLKTLAADANRAYGSLNTLRERERLLSDPVTATGIVASGINQALKPFAQLGLVPEEAIAMVENDSQLRAFAQQRVVNIMESIPGVVTDQDAARFSQAMGNMTESKDVLKALNNFFLYVEESKIRRNEFINKYFKDAPYNANIAEAETAYQRALQTGKEVPLVYDVAMPEENLLSAVMSPESPIFERGLFIGDQYVSGSDLKRAYGDNKEALINNIINKDW